MAPTSTRGRSVPPQKPQPDGTNSPATELGNVNTSASLPSLSAVQPSNPQNSKLATRAEALAKMTFELNIRAVNAQTERLQRDVQALVLSTGEDKEFRQQNESRLEKLWQEILAVKQHMTAVDDGQKQPCDLQTDFEKCQLETKSLISELHSEIKDLKEQIDSLSNQLDELPTVADSPNDSGYKTQSANSTEDSQHTNRERSLNSQTGWDEKNESYMDELTWLGYDGEAVGKASRRIVEAIKSTRRWHRDYKTTKLRESIFTANYLKQQSKRDAPLAVRIQKAILRGIRRKPQPPSSAQPRSLQEFCEGVKWQDVINSVQTLLVENKKDTILDLLSEAS